MHMILSMMNNPFGMAVLLTVVVFTSGLIGYAIWQGFRTWQMKLLHQVDFAREEAYRKLAQESAAVQAVVARDLADLRQRMAAIEKLLNSVE